MIPPERSAELRSALMAWRREIRAVRGTEAERSARDGVQAAKVALGERGCPWWEQTAAEPEATMGDGGPAPREVLLTARPRTWLTTIVARVCLNML